MALLSASHWDHPRIRGEHRACSPAGSAMCGSSPHTRGAPLDATRRAAQWRIIPAYAGSTPASAPAIADRRDHPRIRGEHGTAEIAERLDSGSSPHTRGARGASGARIVRGGIIPAYAGSTLIPCSRATSSSDHPRIRGEHAGLGLGEAAARGSSPHTRGAPGDRHDGHTVQGIIPAYAGSTVTPSTGSVTKTDHPRIRGEHVFREIRIRLQSGSSPHTRGALGGAPGEADPVGIIPAYAGSTAALASQAHSIADHPRIRGEHTQPWMSRVSRRGSSPHTRGARRLRGRRRRRQGIIPAYAGSTSHLLVHEAGYGDHPRIRGEHTRKTLTRADPAGSSPHTRGALGPGVQG